MACQQGPILALRWHDKRDVVVLSTKHTPVMTTVSVRTHFSRRSHFEGEAHGCGRLQQAHGRH